MKLAKLRIVLTLLSGLFAAVFVAPTAHASITPEPPVIAPPLAGSSTLQCALDFSTPGVNIRDLPNTSSGVRGMGYPGDCLIHHAGMNGEEVRCDGGWTSRYWMDITNVRTGVRGWISYCFYVNNQ